jgi:hypothetical protein
LSATSLDSDVEALLEALAEAGVPRSNSVTLADLLGTLVNEKLLSEEDSNNFVQLFHGAKYGKHPPPVRDWEEARDKLRGAIVSLKEKPETVAAINDRLKPPVPLRIRSKRASNLVVLNPEVPMPLVPSREDDDGADAPRPLSRRTKILASLLVVAAVVGGLAFHFTKKKKKTKSHSSFALTNGLFVAKIRAARACPEARGVSFLDVDGDNDLDAFYACVRGPRFFVNNRKSEVSRGGLGVKGPTRSILFADGDGDGTPELFTVNRLHHAKRWNWKDGSYHYGGGIDLGKNNAEGAGFLDADGDGDVELFYANGETGIHLFDIRNGEFVDVSENWGLVGIGAGNGDFVSLADYDNDGDTDILYNIGNGLLLRNEGSRFSVVEDSGISYRASNRYKLGTAFGDMDNDGDLDLFVPQSGKSKLFRNNGDGTFEDVSHYLDEVAKISPQPRSATWGDINNDGQADLLVGFIDRSVHPFSLRRDAMRTTLGHRTLHSSYAATGMVLADVDRDGDLDLGLNRDNNSSLLVIGRGTQKSTRGSVLFDLGWVAPGAWVRVYDDSGALMGAQQVGLAQNMGSQGPNEAHFALEAGSYRYQVSFTDGAIFRGTVELGKEHRHIAVPRP